MLLRYLIDWSAAITDSKKLPLKYILMKLISIPQAEANYLSSPIEEKKSHLHFHDGREGL